MLRLWPRAGRAAPVIGLAFLLMCALTRPASADVVGDWNEIAIEVAQARSLPPPAAERVVAMMHLAMFEAVNSIERRYEPYHVQLRARRGASAEAAAAAAAAGVLDGPASDQQEAVRARLAAYLAQIPDGPGKTAGVRLGEEVAARLLASRANDGAEAPDQYRVRTSAGVYVPTAQTAMPQWPNVTPFGMTSPSQFRPAPPIALDSERWARDYNEIRTFGGRASTERSVRQTEDARFWLTVGATVYYPLVRGVAEQERLDLADSTRLFALVAIARADALIAVFDAKYHYEFWRPVTAIRNGDIDGNDATPREPGWAPIDATPMHPEYPCAHCISAAATATVLERLLGRTSIGEVTVISPTAPGVTHRWSDLHAFVTEVSEARIWAGFHYRFSTEVGADMGRQIGEYTVEHFLRPVSRQ
jgi:hypothetical protein